MPEFKNYAPDHVSFVFKGFPIMGFQDGTFIEAERKEDGFTMHVGALGDVTRVKNLNRTGHVTLTLMAQHPDNDTLQSIADDDEQNSTGVGTLQIMDHNGNMEVHASLAWIRKRPKIDRAKEAGPTTWTFDCADLELNSGGNVV